MSMGMKLRIMAKVGEHGKLRKFNKSIHDEDQKILIAELPKSSLKEFVNIKTKNKYRILGRVINSTNSNDGQTMLLYSDIQGDNLYVREENEFWDKFDLCK